MRLSNPKWLKCPEIVRSQFLKTRFELCHHACWGLSATAGCAGVDVPGVMSVLCIFRAIGLPLTSWTGKAVRAGIWRASSYAGAILSTEGACLQQTL